MKSFFRTSSLLTAGLALAASSSAFAAGDVAATSGYLTIQPNATNDAFVYTFSWVARDTDNTGGGAPAVSPIYTDSGANSNGFGNGGAALDTVTNLGGGDYTFDNTANGGNAATKIRYLPDDLDTYTHATYGTHTRYVDGGFNGVQSATVVSDAWVGYGAYVAGDLAPGDAIPLSTVAAKFDTVGNFLTNPINVVIVADGVQGVTGVFSTNPNGTGAVTGQGVGFALDHDGADDATGTDDFGVFLVGYDNVRNLAGTNKMPNTGYVQFVVPYPTTNVTSDAFAESFYTGTYTRNAAVEVVVTTDASYAPKIALSGDFDGDLDVDNNDILVQIGSFTGSSGTGMWYADGDTDADGDVDNNDILTTIGAFTGSAAGSTVDTGTAADLVYDPITGNVTLVATDSPGGVITGFQIENAAGGDDFLFANYLGAGLGGTVDTTATVIGEANPFGGVSGTIDLGNIFVTGMDLTQLESFLTLANVTGALGNGVQEFDLVVIPEPSSLALLGLGGLLLARHRSRMCQ